MSASRNDDEIQSKSVQMACTIYELFKLFREIEDPRLKGFASQLKDFYERIMAAFPFKADEIRRAISILNHKDAMTISELNDAKQLMSEYSKLLKSKMIYSHAGLGTSFFDFNDQLVGWIHWRIKKLGEFIAFERLSADSVSNRLSAGGRYSPSHGSINPFGAPGRGVDSPVSDGGMSPARGRFGGGGTSQARIRFDDGSGMSQAASGRGMSERGGRAMSPARGRFDDGSGMSQAASGRGMSERGGRAMSPASGSAMSPASGSAMSRSGVHSQGLFQPIRHAGSGRFASEDAGAHLAPSGGRKNGGHSSGAEEGTSSRKRQNSFGSTIDLTGGSN